MLDSRQGHRMVATAVAHDDGAERGIVEAARSGDAEAFGHLYRHYRDPVYRYLAARAASPEEAADLTQQVFLNAFRALPRYRAGESGFAPWLFRIARNIATDASRRRRPVAGLETIPPHLEAANHPTPETAAIENERLRGLHATIAHLDRDKQELLALRYAAGLSSREIGEVVGKSESAVKKQLTRILQTLKEHHRD